MSFSFFLIEDRVFRPLFYQFPILLLYLETPLFSPFYVKGAIYHAAEEGQAHDRVALGIGVGSPDARLVFAAVRYPEGLLRVQEAAQRPNLWGERANTINQMQSFSDGERLKRHAFLRGLRRHALFLGVCVSSGVPQAKLLKRIRWLR